ncbi:MAG: flagellar FlbD family protein [Chitinivibrionales bacterium]
MIALRKFNGEEFVLNAEFILSVEATPDTVITLNSNKKVMVQNSVKEVVQKVIKYRQLCNQSIKVLHQEKGDTDAHLSEDEIEG